MDSEADSASSSVPKKRPKNLLKVCRLCLNEKYLEGLFEPEDLSQWISKYLSIKVSASDEVSKLICDICSSRLKEFREFQRSCLEVQSILQKELSIRRNKNCHYSYRCDVCLNTFESRKNWTAHMRHVHGPKIYECSFCDKSFSKPSRLKAHTATHTAVERKIYQFCCTICSAIFPSQISLKRHHRLHKVTKLRGELRREATAPEITTKTQREVPSPDAERMENNNERNLPENFNMNVCATNAELEKVSPNVKNEHSTISEELIEFAKTSIDQELLDGQNLQIHTYTSQKLPVEHSKLHKQNNQAQLTGLRGELGTYEHAQEATIRIQREVSSPEAEGIEIHHELNDLPENSSNNVLATNAEAEEISPSVKYEHQAISEDSSEVGKISIEQEVLVEQNICVKPAKVVKTPGKQKKSNGPFMCDQCGKRFDIERKIRDHSRMVHGPKRHKCPHCDKAFVTRRDQVKHIGVHQRQLGYQSGGEERREVATASIEQEPLDEQNMCVELVRVVETPGDQKMSSDPLACGPCSKVFGNRKKLRDHMRMVHDPNRLKCPKCDKAFFTSRDLAKHIEGYQFDCTICSAVFRSQYLLKIHSKLHKQNYQAQLSGLGGELGTYESAQDATIRIQSEVSSPETEGTKNNNESYYELNDLPEHFNYNVLATNTEPAEISPSVKNEHQAISDDPSEVAKISIEQELLEDQNKRIEPAKVVETPDEQKKSDNPFVCDQCGKSFGIRKKLVTHRRIVHGPKRHKCPTCDKAFAKRGNLRNHVEIHQRSSGYQFGCTTCSAIFQSQESLKQHSKLHKQNNHSKLTRLREELRPGERSQRELVSSTDTAGMEIYNDSNYELDNLSENFDCAPLESNEHIEYLQPTMLSAGVDVINNSTKDKRKSPIDKPVQKVACTICNQLIDPSLNSLRAHLRTHDVVDAVESPAVAIKVEPLTIDDV